VFLKCVAFRELIVSYYFCPVAAETSASEDTTTSSIILQEVKLEDGEMVPAVEEIEPRQEEEAVAVPVLVEAAREEEERSLVNTVQ
jgi:hypothetical protein